MGIRNVERRSTSARTELIRVTRTMEPGISSRYILWAMARGYVLCVFGCSLIVFQMIVQTERARCHSVQTLLGVVAVTRWVGTHVLESEAKKDGRGVGKGTYEVSKDGTTLTATVAGTDAAGLPFEQIVLFDRE